MSRSASAARMAAARVKAISSRGFGGDARIGRGGGAGDRRANRTHRGRRDASRRLRAVVPPATTSEAATSGRTRRDPMADRSARAVLLLLIVVGAILRVRGLRFGFPHPVARPDEEVLVDAALGVLRDPNPHFFDWPSAFIYATGASYAALFAVERAVGGAVRHAAVAKASFEPVLHLIPRALSATAGVLTIPALYGAARELFSRRIAVVAAAFLAVAFLHVRDSHFGVTDVPAAFLTVCAFWAALRCATEGARDARV